MSKLTVQQLILAGSHFGHLTRRWNPKMKPFIFMEKNGIYIIDLYKTKALLDQACDAIRKITEKGEPILFVGTKKQARDIVASEAGRAGMPYVNERWLGGMLTNFVTIRKSVKKWEDLEKMVTDGTYEQISKKERLTLDKQRKKLEEAFAGIRYMKRLPGAVFVVDTLEEDIAIREARKLGIPVFAIVDTNSDPDIVNFPIPANDDAYKSIGLITKTLTDAVVEGLAKVQAKKTDEPAPAEKKGDGKRPPRRRRTKGGAKGQQQPQQRSGKPQGGKKPQGKGGKPAPKKDAPKQAPKKDAPKKDAPKPAEKKGDSK